MNKKFNTTFNGETIELEKRDYFIPLGEDQELLYEEFSIVNESTQNKYCNEWERRFVVKFDNGSNLECDPFEVFFNWPHS